MPRDATTTRDRLIRAGEQRFARDGVGGAKLRDIVRDAGQANDAAVGYHFGSRTGLLAEIARRHVAAMDGQRQSPTPGDSLEDVVRTTVEPTVELLRNDSGRDFLRIMEQLAGWSGLAEGSLVEVVRGTNLASQLSAIEDRVATRRGRATARARTSEIALFVTASLAQRARVLESGKRPAVSHKAYVNDLVAMLTAALSA